MSLLSRVDIVLVEPEGGSNVGGCARALMNLGIPSLRLVQPSFPQREAERMAVHAHELLVRAPRFGSLPEALADATWVVGTTARNRDNPERKPILSLDEFVARLSCQPESARVAVVFGPERSGLTNLQLGLCQDVLCIPADPAYPVLNLAQAVLLVSWEIRKAALGPTAPPAPREAVTASGLDGLVEHLRFTLSNLGFLDPQNPQLALDELRAIFGRAVLSPRELKLLRGILHKMDVFVSSRGGPPTPNQPRGRRQR